MFSTESIETIAETLSLSSKYSLLRLVIKSFEYIGSVGKIAISLPRGDSSAFEGIIAPSFINV